MPILRLEAVGRRFGSLNAVSNVSFEMDRHEILALIGPNGAGKSTLVNLISGLDDGRQGRIWFKERDVTGTPAHARALAGIARTFQLVKLIGGLPILENVMSGGYRVGRSGILDIALGRAAVSAEEAQMAALARQKLEFVGLGHIDPGADCDTLTYGQQRLVEIARALAAEPDLILLDEPAAGLTTAEALQLQGLVREIRDSGIGVLLVEHNMKLVAAVSDRCVVLHLGEKLAEGSFAEIASDPRVRKAYLGDGATDAAH